MDYEDAVQQIERAIADALEILPAAWVLIAADSERAVHFVNSPGLPQWQRYGLLGWASQAAVPQPDWLDAYDEDEGDE